MDQTHAMFLFAAFDALTTVKDGTEQLISHNFQEREDSI
jgi:hypothetical protein